MCGAVFGTFLAWMKFFFAKPENIQLPKAKWDHIKPEPMGESDFRGALTKVMVCSPAPDIHGMNASWFLASSLNFRSGCTKCFSPMQPGLPPINSDPQVALKHAFNGLRRKLFHAPELPAEYLGSPDLGSLAVRGPFACYTTQRKPTPPGSGTSRCSTTTSTIPGW